MTKEAKQYVLTKCGSFTSPLGKRYLKGLVLTPTGEEEAAYLEKNRHFEVYKAPKADK